MNQENEVLQDNDVKEPEVGSEMVSEAEDILSQKAKARAAEYRYIMENANTVAEKREVLAAIKKDSCPNIRSMYEEYTEKNPELVQPPEQENSKQQNQPSPKRGIKKAFDL